MNEGYVYLIGTPIFGWYKMGKSRTPEVREAKRLESMVKHAEKKRLRENQKEIQSTSSFSRMGLNNI